MNKDEIKRDSSSNQETDRFINIMDQNYAIKMEGGSNSSYIQEGC